MAGIFLLSYCGTEGLSYDDDHSMLRYVDISKDLRRRSSGLFIYYLIPLSRLKHQHVSSSRTFFGGL